MQGIKSAAQLWFDDYLLRCSGSIVDEIKALLFDVIVVPQLVGLAFYLLINHTQYAYDALAGMALLMPLALHYSRKMRRDV